jgi:hypothetical protein
LITRPSLDVGGDGDFNVDDDGDYSLDAMLVSCIDRSRAHVPTVSILVFTLESCW